MKRVAIIFLVSAFVVISGSVFSQKLKSGSFSDLKGQSELNLQYDYSNLKVGKKAEADYVKEGIEERNKKKEGSGEVWAQAWVNDRDTRYEPMFEKNINGSIGKCGLTAKENATNAKYTLIIRITFIEPGFQSGVGVSKPAYINILADLVETANPGTVLGTIDYPKIESVNMMGYDFDTGSRIQSCFDRGGDGLGKAICKMLK
jgi:hypothetical protein